MQVQFPIYQKQCPNRNQKRRPDLTLQCHLRYIRYIAAEGGNVVPESMKQKSKTIFPNDIVAKSRAGTNTLQRLNATSTFTLHLTPDQDNTSQKRLCYHHNTSSTLIGGYT